MASVSFTFPRYRWVVQRSASCRRMPYRVTVPFRCLSIVLRHGKKKLQDLPPGDAVEVTLTKSPSKSAEHELTCLDGIFFSSWLCGTADGNRRLGKHSCCTSCGWGSMSGMLTLGIYTMIQIGYRETLPAPEIPKLLSTRKMLLLPIGTFPVGFPFFGAFS